MYSRRAAGICIWSPQSAGPSQMQYRPTIITGCLTGTGLAMSPDDITH
ncbi:hypothetical protein [Streptomyces sp. NPDC002265]